MSSLVLVAWLAAGCATIVGSKTQDIPVDSSPTGAQVIVKDETGNQVHSGVTPMMLRLKKGGGYFSDKQYSIEFSMVGYGTQTVWLEGTPNFWYLFGNMIFFPVIGHLVVDPISGAMWHLEPDTINVALQPIPLE